MQPATTNQHIEALLRLLARIGPALRDAVEQFRRTQPNGPDQLRGLYISDAEIDAILATGPLDPLARVSSPVVSALPLVDKPASIVRGAIEAGSRLEMLVQRFGLDELGTAILLLALTPEIDLAYERIYAYLQDDATRRRPTVDLLLRLLCSSRVAMLAARAAFASDAPLLRHRLLRLTADPADHEPPLLRLHACVEERVVSYLLGSDEPDVRVQSYLVRLERAIPLDSLLLPDELRQRLMLLTERRDAWGTGPLIYFQGPYGVGKRTAAAALCAARGQSLLVVDGEQLLLREGMIFEALVGLVVREALLLGAAICWRGFDLLLADERRREREVLLRELARLHSPAFLAGNTAWEPAGDMAGLPFVRFELPQPNAAERALLWKRALDCASAKVDPDDLARLAGAFRLSGGQIRDAAATAFRLAQMRAVTGPLVNASDLVTACRLHSNQRLADLARRINPRRGWEDLVLPEDRVAQLRELCDAARQRARVYDDWGFERRFSLGKGISALFTGPPGTGKTLAAEIIAGTLGRELYTIDLATVVSKYIGETEKNLARIFDEAASSNAVLFFDEADALFGKRSEVKDAHDRYANLEIAYLLQRLEAYEGLVILASNLRKNIDDAFVRRLRFIVEFPFPAESERCRIWQTIWPSEVPRDAALDPAALARRFELAGGSISNIALGAAYLAAADGQVVTLEHLLHAARREYQKLGKVVSEAEFV